MSQPVHDYLLLLLLLIIEWAEQEGIQVEAT